LVAVSSLHGLKGNKKGYYYKWISYNKFEDDMSKIPKGAEPLEYSKTYIEKYWCGTRKVFIPDFENCHSFLKRKNYKIVFTLDNGGIPFCVFYKKNDIIVFKMNEEYVIENWKMDPCFYTVRIAQFSPKEVILGKSIKNKMTEFSGNYGAWATGNSILLWIKENEYVYIGESIFKFKSLAKIVKYFSPIGNSSVPYPYAVDEEERYYLLIENLMIKHIPRGFKKDPYDYYYDKKKFTRYNPEPGKFYDRMIDSWKKNNQIYKEVDGKIKMIGRKNFEITREEYVKSCNEFGKKMGFSKLKNKRIIAERYV